MKQKGHLFKLVTLLSILLFSQYLASEEKSTSIKEPCELVYGWATWPPLQYYKANGEVTGIQTDMVKAIAEKVNCKLIFVESDWSGIVDLIKRGKIDFTANATPTTERKAFARFSQSYRRDSYAIWVRTEDFEKYKTDSVKALKKSGVTLGLTRNHVYGDELDAWQNDRKYSKNIIYAPSSIISMERLISGEVDGLIEDPFIIAYKKRTKIITADISRLPINIFGHKVSFMFSKKSVPPNIVEKFNVAIKQLRDSNEYRSIWLDPQFQME